MVADRPRTDVEDFGGWRWLGSTRTKLRSAAIAPRIRTCGPSRTASIGASDPITTSTLTGLGFSVGRRLKMRSCLVSPDAMNEPRGLSPERHRLEKELPQRLG